MEGMADSIDVVPIGAYYGKAEILLELFGTGGLLLFRSGEAVWCLWSLFAGHLRPGGWDLTMDFFLTNDG